MCGRFAQYIPANIIREHLKIDVVSGEGPESYNVSPGSNILAVIRHDNLRLGNIEWGYVPSWEKDFVKARKHINARVETIGEKNTFKKSFQQRRCLIPANGYYEWQGEKGDKTPWYISPSESDLLCFAGIWNTWKGAEDEKNHTCAIITKAADPSLSHIHHRMPVIVKAVNYSSWLDPNNGNSSVLASIINDSVGAGLNAWMLSTFVNSADNDGAECIKPII